MSVFHTLSEIYGTALNNGVTLKSGLEVTHGNRKWYHSEAWVRFPIRIL